MRTALRICLATAGLALAASAAHAQSSKEDIQWNDPPKPATSSKNSIAPTPLVPPPASSSRAPAPIRDDYAAKPKASESVRSESRSASTGTWSDPSMTSKGTVGKSNTSVATSVPTPGVAGPCREFEQDVFIDGHREKAHGRACRQPDGTWKLQN